MHLFRFAVLVVLLVSKTAFAETDFGALIDLVGKVVESATKNNNPQAGGDTAKDGQQSSSSDNDSSTEISGGSEPLSLQQPSRSLDRTLKLIESEDVLKNNPAGFFVTPQGKLVVWGSNENDRFGMAEAKYTTSAGITEYQSQKFYNKPVIHPAFDGVVSVDACGFRAIVLNNKGEAWVFGYARTADRKAVPNYVTPTKIPGDGYIEAKIKCANYQLHRESINLLKNDGTFWRLDGFRGVGDSLKEPTKLVSGVKSFQTVHVASGAGIRGIDGFILLLNNGNVATTFHHVYGAVDNKSGQNITSKIPKLAIFPNLKDIVRIQSNNTTPYFTAYAADGSIYEVPLRGFVNGKLSNGLAASFVGSKAQMLSRGLGRDTGFPSEQSEPLIFNDYKMKGIYTFTSLIKPTEIANARNVCYGSMVSLGVKYYGLMSDKSGAVSAWSLYKGFKGLGLEDKLIPQKISLVSDVEEIECGDQFLLFKLKNGDIKIFADEQSKVLGISPIKKNQLNILFNENYDFAATN